MTLPSMPTATPPNIALYGRTGSGKTTVADALVRNFGYSHRKTGAACRALCLELFGSENKALMNQVTDALRDIDPAVWLRAALRGMEEGDGRPIVLDSIRFRPDYRYVIERGFVTIQVKAGSGSRVERLADRGQEFDLLRDDLHPAEIELASEEFDFTIENDGSLGDLIDDIERLANELGL